MNYMLPVSFCALHLQWHQLLLHHIANVTGLSNATTVRASTPEVAKNNARMKALREKEAKAAKAKNDADLETPPCKAKGPMTKTDSAPKMKQQARSNEAAVATEKATAAKARPAKATAPVKPVQPPMKAEPCATPSARIKRSESDVAHSSLAKAVTGSLTRGVTADISGTGDKKDKEVSSSGKLVKTKTTDHGKKDTCDASQGEPEDNEDSEIDEAAVEKARLKRVNHARFMRFSRSLKSAWAAFDSRRANLFWDSMILKE